MALKPLKPQSPKEVDYSREIADLRAKIDKLVKDYELYFSGVLKLEPQLQRREVMTIFARLGGAPITNQTQLFQLNQIKSKFNSYNTFWVSTLRKIEEGTYHRDRYQIRHAETPDQPPPTGSSGDAPERRETPKPTASEQGDERRIADKRIEHLFNEYIVARLEVHETIDGVTQEWFRNSLKEQHAALASRYGDAKEIGFKVVVQDGKAKVKAVLKDKGG